MDFLNVNSVNVIFEALQRKYVIKNQLNVSARKMWMVRCVINVKLTRTILKKATILVAPSASVLAPPIVALVYKIRLLKCTALTKIGICTM